MTPTPEFTRPVRLDTIGAGASVHRVDANPEERAATAARFGLTRIDRLEAHFTLSRQGQAVRAKGRLSGAVVQPCVATGEPVPATIETDFVLNFVPEPTDGADEIEIDAEDLDTIEYSGGSVDLGEAAAETLALALDPYPRSPAAAASLTKAGILNEEEAKIASSPFAALAKRKD